jgi:hypothetical protein
MSILYQRGVLVIIKTQIEKNLHYSAHDKIMNDKTMPRNEGVDYLRHVCLFDTRFSNPKHQLGYL